MTARDVGATTDRRSLSARQHSSTESLANSRARETSPDTRESWQAKKSFFDDFYNTKNFALLSFDENEGAFSLLAAASGTVFVSDAPWASGGRQRAAARRVMICRCAISMKGPPRVARRPVAPPCGRSNGARQACADVCRATSCHFAPAPYTRRPSHATGVDAKHAARISKTPQERAQGQEARKEAQAPQAPQAS